MCCTGLLPISMKWCCISLSVCMCIWKMSGQRWLEQMTLFCDSSILILWEVFARLLFPFHFEDARSTPSLCSNKCIYSWDARSSPWHSSNKCTFFCWSKRASSSFCSWSKPKAISSLSSNKNIYSFTLFWWGERTASSFYSSTKPSKKLFYSFTSESSLLKENRWFYELVMAFGIWIWLCWSWICKFTLEHYDILNFVYCLS